METFSALLALCAGNSPVPGGFPSQRPVTRSFEVFFDLRLNKRLSKQSWGWWFETTPHPLRRHSNEVLTCLFGAKSLADPKRAYCKLYPRGKVLKCRETSKMQKMFFFLSALFIQTYWRFNKHAKHAIFSVYGIIIVGLFKWDTCHSIGNTIWFDIHILHYDDVIMGVIVSQTTSLTMFTQPFIQTQIKENIKAPRHWPLCGEFTGDRWIPRTNGQ